MRQDIPSSACHLWLSTRVTSWRIRAAAWWCRCLAGQAWQMHESPSLGMCINCHRTCKKQPGRSFCRSRCSINRFSLTSSLEGGRSLCNMYKSRQVKQAAQTATGRMGSTTGHVVGPNIISKHLKAACSIHKLAKCVPCCRPQRRRTDGSAAITCSSGCTEYQTYTSLAVLERCNGWMWEIMLQQTLTRS